MEKTKSVRIHRVGTVTFGCVLIVFGILFLSNIFLPALSYEFIFKLWPIIFIILGIEVLIGNSQRESRKNGEIATEIRFEYDKTAIVLMVCLTFFAMVMAAVEFSI